MCRVSTHKPDTAVLCTTYKHCPLKQSIETTHFKKSCASFFIRLTTLNDAKIDKDLLLTKFVSSNSPVYLTSVMTAVSSRSYEVKDKVHMAHCEY